THPIVHHGKLSDLIAEGVTLALRPGTLAWIFWTGSSSALTPHSHLNVTIAIPPDLHRHFAFLALERLGADVLAGAVVDFLIGTLVDPKDQHQATAGLELTTGETVDLERQRLTLAGSQE